MPGLLNSLFEPDAQDSPDGQDQSTQQYDASADGGLDLSPSVGLSHEAEASWQDADGTTHTYSSDTDIVLTVDVEATLGATGSLAQSSYDAA